MKISRRFETSGTIDVVTAPLVFVDKNAFIIGIESPTDAAQPMPNLLLRLRETPGLGATNDLTLAEFFAPASRPGHLATLLKRRLYMVLLIWSQLFDLRPTTRDILIETGDLREAVRYKPQDAMRLITVVRAQCNYFLSYNTDVKPPQGMKRIPPDRSGIDVKLGARSQES